MLMPKRTKFRKKMRDRMKRSATTGNTVSFGSVALQATDRGYVSNRQIEAARRVITRTLKRDGKTWIRIFPDKPITSKPAEVRMGKGKGAVDSWVAVVRPGRIIYEIDGVSEEVATEALRLEELANRRNELKEEHMRLRFSNVIKQLGDVTMIRKTRKEIARINTLITEKQREAAAEQNAG